ncbi:MAG: FHA domain-containing protein [Myxococcaceae bacterium]|nr:FHA domain-containing protein [Myxococcaceae bacterium]
MPTLVIKGPDGNEQEQDFADALTVGRAEGNDLILSEGGVSRKHARFFLDGDALMVEDLGSANGTLVNGERIEGPAAVPAGATIILGDYEVTLKVESRSRPKVDKAQAKPSSRGTQSLKRPASLAKAGGGERSTKVMPAVKPSASKDARRAGSKGPVLRGLSGTVTGKSFDLAGVMVVGRVAGVDVRVDDDSVSRRHAEVEVKGREVVLRDLGSANGTTVNGSPITEDTPLSPGDIIQFGVVELMYENGAPSGSKGAVSRAPRSAPERPARRSRVADDEPIEAMATATSPMDPKKKRLFVVGGAVLAFLFVAVLVKGLTADPGVGNPNPTGQGGPVKPPPPTNPADEIDELLKVCRTYASCEGRSADWARAEAACAKIIDLEPIHEQANELMKRITHEKAAEQAYLKGKEFAAAGRREEALDSFAKVKPFSKEISGCYFLPTFSFARPVIDEEKKALAGECKAYASGGKWENALKSCEAYMRLACQAMSREELVPPYPKQLKLDGALGPNDWRPTDPTFLNFLRARQKLRPGDVPWTCPELAVFKPPPKAKPIEDEVIEQFKARYPTEPEIAKSLGLYFKGAFAESRIPLQRILETVSKAKLHDETRELLLDVDNAASFFRTGQTELSNDKPEKAEDPFRKALALDEKVVLGPTLMKLPDEQRRKEIEKRSSFVRKGIVEGMGSTCYAKGKALADKKDFRAACRVWKLGISFNRANADLLKAGYFCTQRAGEALKKADSCPALSVVLDLAVDGDGYKEKVEEMAVENGCK